MLNDEIIDEVRANREAHAAKFNYNLRAIYNDLKKSEAKHVQNGSSFVDFTDNKTANDNMHSDKPMLRRFAL
ncbi:MAG: hypothetical protein HOL93_11715 [Candidatus Marinimicrobia bacterium]|jgi:hypothetical protein|nr:hypothetical protein [Candidatus Neomarinimicrobiota bacterium]